MGRGPASFGDVRMRGFTGRARVEEALAWVDGAAQALAPEAVEVRAAHGRVLAEEVRAGIDVPAFDRSAMDGYALRGAETVGAGAYNPLRFAVVGESLPGRPYPGVVLPGTAVRIMTGAPLPTGADAVVPAEYAAEHAGCVDIASTIAPDKHVGHVGEDVAAGEVVIRGEQAVARPGRRAHRLGRRGAGARHHPAEGAHPGYRR